MRATPGSNTPPDRIQPAVAWLASLRWASSRRAHTLALNRAAGIILRVNPASLDRFTRARLWQYVDWTRLNARMARAIVARLDDAPGQRAEVLSALQGVIRQARAARKRRPVAL